LAHNLRRIQNRGAAERDPQDRHEEAALLTNFVMCLSPPVVAYRIVGEKLFGQRVGEQIHADREAASHQQCQHVAPVPHPHRRLGATHPQSVAHERRRCDLNPELTSVAYHVQVVHRHVACEGHRTSESSEDRHCIPKPRQRQEGAHSRHSHGAEITETVPASGFKHVEQLDAPVLPDSLHSPASPLDQLGRARRRSRV